MPKPSLEIPTGLLLDGIAVSIILNNDGCFVSATKNGKPMPVHYLYQSWTPKTFNMPIELLIKSGPRQSSISNRALNALRAMGIRSVGDLVQKTEAELLRGRFFGPVCLEFIKTLLQNRGLCLGMNLQE